MDFPITMSFVLFFFVAESIKDDQCANGCSDCPSVERSTSADSGFVSSVSEKASPVGNSDRKLVLDVQLDNGDMYRKEVDGNMETTYIKDRKSVV